MDLLTALMHEYGHVAGLEHTDQGVMSAALATGTRIAPRLAAVVASEDAGERMDRSSTTVPIDWSVPTQQKSGAPTADAKALPSDWKGRFVNELGARGWSESPNAKLRLFASSFDRLQKH